MCLSLSCFVCTSLDDISQFQSHFIHKVIPSQSEQSIAFSKSTLMYAGLCIGVSPFSYSGIWFQTS